MHYSDIKATAKLDAVDNTLNTKYTIKHRNPLSTLELLVGQSN